jgi:phospho-N-acetylmuramoyl-pentapeptide-transferase
MTTNAIKILLSAVGTFSVGMFVSSYLIAYGKKHEWWKKNRKVEALTGGEAVITQQIRNRERNDGGKNEDAVVRPGGVVIWLSVFLVAAFFWILADNIPFINKIDFVSRNQTWLIIFGMVFTGLLGLVDDLSICGKNFPLIKNNGLSFKWRILVMFLLSVFIAYWFFVKLEMIEIFVPFFGLLNIGILIVPLIILAVVVMSCVSVIDGIDGLSGGLFAVAFASYGLIAVAQDQINIAAFCFAVVGACVAFLWYNIMPAKFYNSETGVLSLSTSLTLIALLTNQLFVLPIIALPLLSGPISSFLQIFSKKFFGKKMFIVAPLHHHFQAIGFASHTVVMRYWIVAIMCSFLGTILALAGSL